VRGKGGRTIQVHSQEALLQQARAFQSSDAFRPYRALRQVAEHRLARLIQLGLRQARYRGIAKTLFQAFMAATVANLSLLAAVSNAHLLLLALAASLTALLVGSWRVEGRIDPPLAG
jgi:hypothetical protein